jgi:hypothetical protein
MTTLKMGPEHTALLLGFVGLSVAFLEFGALVPNRGALLVTLVFWTMLAQGAVAVVAVGDLTNARWIVSLKRELLCFYPLLLFIAIMFILLLPIIGLYPWTERPGLWLNKPFFMVRNLVLLLLAYWTARLFARRSLREDERKKEFAAYYLLVFVTSQTLVAFDWVMSLEYPWFSTILGAYFFVESFYAGLALAAIIYFLHRQEFETRIPARHLMDLATLIFGFSILWTGLFFAQFLLLWYGNLPYEVGSIVQRLDSPGLRLFVFLFIPANFLVPFLVLMSQRAKGNIHVVFVVSVIILAGQFIEKLFLILPRVALHGGILALQSLLIFIAVLMILHSRDLLLPSFGARSSPD